MPYRPTGKPPGRPRKNPLPLETQAPVADTVEPAPTALPVPKKRQRPERPRAVFAAGLNAVLKTGASIPYPGPGRAKPMRPARTMLRSPV